MAAFLDSEGHVAPLSIAVVAAPGVHRRRRAAILGAAAVLFTACGGAGGSSQTAPEPPVDPPAALVYAVNPAVYTRGAAIAANAPTSSGGAPAAYSVAPALPAGLALNPATGVVAGIPTAPAPAATYVVTATNAGGSARANLVLSVVDVAPSALAYATLTAVYTKGTPIEPNAPTSAGGAVVSYAISPPLPTGLALDTAKGVIVGTPTVLANTASFTITATNTGGTTTAMVTITVNDDPPVLLMYAADPAFYTLGVEVPPNAPFSSGGAIVSYSASPPLPAGLALDSSTGVISGVPRALVETSRHTITATNSGGSTTAAVTITVRDVPPTALVYAYSTATYTKGLPIAPNAPTSGGGPVVAYSVVPSLPAGLALDETAGVISGTPTVLAGAATYTVTATNSGGSTTSALVLTVNPPPPVGLTYAANPAIYTVGLSIAPNVPSSGGGAVTSYSVAPALPEGLALDTVTGVITGTPITITAARSCVVIAANAGGSSSATLTVSVNPSPPVFTTWPASQTVFAGQAATFAAAASGTGPLTWSWSKNGAVVPNSESASFTTPPSHEIDDGAIFTVVVADAFGGQAIASATLSVRSNFAAAGGVTPARDQHAAALLADGRVLVVGGNTGYLSPTASAQVYDPASGTFSATGALGIPRTGLTATTLGDGRVLVAGGGGPDGWMSATAEVYDPSTGTFTPTAAAMATARAEHRATSLQDGRVLITGGYGVGGGVASAELFDPATGTFSPAGDAPASVGLHTATRLADGTVLIAGMTSQSVQLFDPVMESFVSAGSLLEPRSGNTSTLLPDGRVLIAGGEWVGGSVLPSTAELYDPATQTSVAAGNFYVYDHTATLLLDGTILLAGGGEPDGPTGATAEVYDPSAGTFTPIGTIVVPRAGHTATLLRDGTVLLVAGYQNGVKLASAERYVGPGSEPGAGP